MIVEARALDVTIGDAPILRGVDLGVRGGEFVALVGPNGAGKSTLLAALAGDLPPTRGTVAVNGSPIGSLRPIALARLRSVLPQHAKTLFSFNAADVVAMGRHPHANTEDDETAVRQALERVGVLHLAHRSFPTLSGGEQTLINLARVLAQQTPLVLLDEPTAALDLGHQELVCTIASELAAQGRAVVVVLHELNLAARYAHRVIVLQRGRIVADADPTEAFTAQRLSALYGHPVTVIDHPLQPGRPLILPNHTAIDHPTTDHAFRNHTFTDIVAAVPAPTS